MTTGEKCNKLINILEKKDSLYTGPASRSLPRLRDHLLIARSVRNKVAHDANYNPPDIKIRKAQTDYELSIKDMLVEFAS